MVVRIKPRLLYRTVNVHTQRRVHEFLVKIQLVQLLNQCRLRLHRRPRRRMKATETYLEAAIAESDIEADRQQDRMAAEVLVEVEVLQVHLSLGSLARRRSDRVVMMELIRTSTLDRLNQNLHRTQRTGKKAKFCGGTANRR